MANIARCGPRGVNPSSGFFTTASLTLMPASAPEELTMTGFCTFCNLPEDTEHLFLHCPRAQSFWGAIGVTSSNLLQIEALWEIALPGPTCSSLQTRSTVLTGLLLNLWKCRNAQVFDHVQEANFVVFARCASDFCLWQNRQRETVDKFCNEDSL